MNGPMDGDHVLVWCPECEWQGVRQVPPGYWQTEAAQAHMAAYLTADYGTCPAPECIGLLEGDRAAICAYQTGTAREQWL